MQGSSLQETARQLDAEERRRLKTLLYILIATIIVAGAIYLYLRTLQNPQPTGDPTYYTGPMWSKSGLYYATGNTIFKYRKEACEAAGVRIPSGATVVTRSGKEYIQP